jgi:DNA-binding PadR family transcriptional regulator
MDKTLTPYLPLTETTLFILLSLTARPKHGYAIMKEVLELSQGRLNLTAGTLYGALKRLLEQDWIERIDDPDPAAGHPGQERKAYALTALGQTILDAEIARLQAVLKAVRRHAVKGQA